MCLSSIETLSCFHNKPFWLRVKVYANVIIVIITKMGGVIIVIITKRGGVIIVIIAKRGGYHSYYR